MKTTLPTKITTIKEAEQFLKALNDNKEVFHPEDDASEIFSGLSDDQPLFTFEEANKLNALMDQINDIPDFDPCEFILNLDPEYKLNSDID